MVVSVGAQSPSAVPTTNASVTANGPNPIPVNPPPGWDPKMWAADRQECQRLRNKGERQWTRSDFDTMGACRAKATMLINPNLGGSSAPQASPLPTPVPPQSGSALNPRADLVVLSASAQQPGATPARSPTPRSARWATLHCDELWAAVLARRGMTPDQLSHAQPFGGSWTNEHSLWHECYEANPAPSPVKTYPSPYNKGPFIELTLLPPPPNSSSAADWLHPD
jgi:hypothetical protein